MVLIIGKAPTAAGTAQSPVISWRIDIPPGGRDALPGPGWLQTFPVDRRTLATEGESPYFILKPGYQTTFEGKADGKAGKLVITVLNETLNVGGVDTRIVEEREWSGGELVEVSRNYFAIEPETGDVYYFGEDVDMYKKGKVVNHEGSWRHGANGATFGLMSRASRSGMRFYQESVEGRPEQGRKKNPAPGRRCVGRARV